MKFSHIIVTFCVISLIPFQLPSQKISISGTVTDKSTGEFIIGATVASTSTGIGVTTNNYGFYSLSIPKRDSLGIIYSFLGYQPIIKKVFPGNNIFLDIQLEKRENVIDEVTIHGNAENHHVRSTQMSVMDIPISKIKELPVILGEPDVLKIIQLLPGVQSGNEGTTAFFVRGGGGDQNLILLDEAVMYNPNHLVGLVSTFNSRAINNVKLIKGGFPAEFGGRLSSVLNVNLREGNKKKFSGEGGIGLIASNLSLEGPILKNRSSFIVSGRRTYFDYLIKPFLPKSINTNYVFYDINAKLNHQINLKNRVFLSAYRSRDKAFYAQDAIEYQLGLENNLIVARWNHIYSPRLFSNLSIIYNNHDQDISALQDNAIAQVISGIEDISSKISFEFYPDRFQVIKFGLSYDHHRFRSRGDSRLFSGNDPTLQDLDSIPQKRFNEFAVYLSEELKASPRFSIVAGLRAPLFYNAETEYFRLEPRLALKYMLNSHNSLKAAYSRMNQFIHRIPSTAAALPTDIWVPSSRKTRPQTSQQYALGYFYNFPDRSLEFSAEVYYKTMQNQILFREGNQLISSLDVDDLLVSGKGWSYGSEFWLKKKTGPWTAWLSYTLSWTYQKFSDLNFGNKFPFRHDKRHNLSLVGSYQVNDRWNISGTFVYTSGSAFTVPEGRIPVQNGGSLFEGNYYIYGARNNARLANFHRLNLAFSYKKERTIFKRKYMSEWVFSIYNVYNRQNPYFIYFDVDVNTENPRARQVSLLPIIPSVSYNFKF